MLLAVRVSLTRVGVSETQAELQIMRNLPSMTPDGDHHEVHGRRPYWAGCDSPPLFVEINLLRCRLLG